MAVTAKPEFSSSMVDTQYRKGILAANLLILLSIIILSVICWYISQLGAGIYAWFVLGGVSVYALAQGFFLVPLMMRTVGKEPQYVTGADSQRLVHINDEVAARAGMTGQYKLLIINDNTPNAWAVNGFFSRAVGVHKGLFRHLNDEELAAVIAHELSHIRMRDTILLIIANCLIMSFIMLGRICLEIAWRKPSSSSSRKSNDSGAMVTLAFLGTGLSLLALGYIVAPLSSALMSRFREYAADSGAIALGYGPALASALRKLEHAPRTESHNPGLVGLYFSPPQTYATSHRRSGLARFADWFASLSASHPPTEKRVDFIERCCAGHEGLIPDNIEWIVMLAGWATLVFGLGFWAFSDGVSAAVPMMFGMPVAYVALSGWFTLLYTGLAKGLRRLPETTPGVLFVARLVAVGVSILLWMPGYYALGTLVDIPGFYQFVRPLQYAWLAVLMADTLGEWFDPAETLANMLLALFSVGTLLTMAYMLVSL